MSFVPYKPNLPNSNQSQNPNIYLPDHQQIYQNQSMQPAYQGVYNNQNNLNERKISSKQGGHERGQERNFTNHLNSSQINSSQINVQWPTGQSGINVRQNANNYGGMRRQVQIPSNLIGAQNVQTQEISNLRRTEEINNQITVPARNVSVQNNDGGRAPNPQQNLNFPESNQYRAQVSEVSLGKMDGIFAQSFKSLKCQHIASTFIVLTLLMSVLLLYKFKVFKGGAGQLYGFDQEEGHLKFSIIPFLIAFQSIILCAKLYLFIDGYSSLRFALHTSQKISCTSPEQQADPTTSFDQNISKKFLSAQTSTLYTQVMIDQLKKTLLDSTQKKIKHSLKDHFCCSYQIMEISRFGMFVSAIVLIVALAQGHTTWIQKLILITIIVFWMIKNYRKILYAGVLLVCPFLTIVIILYLCFCADKKKEIQIPKATNPTQQQILSSGGTCSICMMQFDKSDSVVILQCTGKHMFHQLCINGWLNLKTTCPMCRFDLAE